MRIIERSEFRDEKGVISTVNRILGTLKHGTYWYAEMTAQDLVTQWLKKALGNEIVLLRNIDLPTIDVPLPMILIGFQRIYIILATSARVHPGSRSIQDHVSRILNEPRPQLRLLTAVQSLYEYLVEQGVDSPHIEAVLVLTDPRSYPDLTQPDIHVVFADTIEPFIANLAHSSQPASTQYTKQLLDILVEPKHPPSAPTGKDDSEESDGANDDEELDMTSSYPFSPAHPLRPKRVALGPFRFPKPRLTRIGVVIALGVAIMVLLGLWGLATNLLG